MNCHAETKKIQEVIRNYTEGTFEGDAAKLAKAFHPNAVMNGFLGDNLLLATPQAFIDDIANNPPMATQNVPYNAEIESIRIEGDVAAVVLSETGFRGAGQFVDFFHLIKDNGEWKIISKLFITVF